MFRDRSDLLADADPVRGYGAAVTPGRDGPLVFVAGYGEPNRLYVRDGADGGATGTDRFVDTACGIVADGDRHGMGVCAADVDGDGCEEIYVHNCANYAGMTGDPDLLLNRLESERYRWTDAFALEVNADRLNFRAGRSVAALDRFGTGRYGFAVASYGAPVAFYELGDDGEVSDMAAAVGLDVEGSCRSLLPGPVVSELDVDLFVGVEHGPNRLFRNEGGHYVEVDPSPALADPEGDARGVALVDEGGRSSLAIGNWEGRSRICRRRPDGEAFTDVAPPSLSAAGSVRSVVAADFDNDGRQELLCNALGEPNRLFRSTDDPGAARTERESVESGAETETSVEPDAETEASVEADAEIPHPRWELVDAGSAAEPDGFGTGAVAADLDGDGVLELLVVHGEVAAQPITVHAVPEAAANGWLRIRPTTRHGAPARGALVTLETGSGRQRRTIDAGSGYLCQTEPVAHFGLGGATPKRVTVRWPDGRERTLDRPDADAEHVVGHPRADAG